MVNYDKPVKTGEIRPPTFLILRAQIRAAARIDAFDTLLSIAFYSCYP
jgi:hypothetical protein